MSTGPTSGRPTSSGPTSSGPKDAGPVRAASVRSLVRDTVARVAPRTSDYAGLRRSWPRDLLAGVTVAIVALPLALGFGLSSGMGATAGLVTAVVAGAVAAALGGSHLQVSGPTGAMTVVLLPVVARHGTQAVAAVAILAGVIVVVGGLLGLGRLVGYIPWPVVEGFTMGIGVVIALQQVPLALDTAKGPGQNAAVVAWRTLGRVDWQRAWPAVVVVAGVALVMAALPRVLRAVPASLVAVALATGVAELCHLPVQRIGALPSAFPAPHLPLLDLATTRALFSSALAVAALAALESLLSARVADGMADDIARTAPDRELVGQGLGNVAAGLFGGMPATGAIARTAVNVRTGARTRVSALVHAAVLALVVLVAAPVVARIPTSALAGVLLVTACRMVDVRTARAIWRSGRAGALVLTATFVVTVAFDLVLAVEVGVAVAAALALRAFAQASGLRREALPAADPDAVGAATEHALLHEHIALYRIDGALFFADVRRFLDEIARISDVRVVVLRLSSIRVLDASGAAALGEIVADLQRRGIVVLLKGLRDEHRRLVESVGALAALQHERHLFADLDAAVEHARSHVRRALDADAARTDAPVSLPV